MQSTFRHNILPSFPYGTMILGLSWFFGVSMTVSIAQPAVNTTPEVPLNEIQHVLITTLALTERGLQDSSSIHRVVSTRLEQAGFNPVADAKMPHDITVRVKCEERKSKTGPGKHRKGGHAMTTASRLWQGPVCLISYRQQGKAALWTWEVRTVFEDARQAAKAANATNSGLYALQELQTQLLKDDFPLYLAAEWGQTDRLINLFKQATDQLDRRRLILQLLGPLSSPNALTTIQNATHDPALALIAIEALGNQGEVAITALIEVLDTPGDQEQHLAALQALSEISTHSATPVLFELFVKQLQSSDPRMQTIAVRGLGSLGNQLAVDPINELNVQAWSNPSTHTDMHALREALNDTLYQLDPQAGSH